MVSNLPHVEGGSSSSREARGGRLLRRRKVLVKGKVIEIASRQTRKPFENSSFLFRRRRRLALFTEKHNLLSPPPRGRASAKRIMRKRSLSERIEMGLAMREAKSIKKEKDDKNNYRPQSQRDSSGRRCGDETEGKQAEAGVTEARRGDIAAANNGSEDEVAGKPEEDAEKSLKKRRRKIKTHLFTKRSPHKKSSANEIKPEKSRGRGRGNGKWKVRSLYEGSAAQQLSVCEGLVEAEADAGDKGGEEEEEEEDGEEEGSEEEERCEQSAKSSRSKAKASKKSMKKDEEKKEEVKEEGVVHDDSNNEKSYVREKGAKGSKKRMKREEEEKEEDVDDVGNTLDKSNEGAVSRCGGGGGAGEEEEEAQVADEVARSMTRERC